MPATCLRCCDNRLRKIREDVTEALKLVPRQWKVIQHVREKFVCHACVAITQPSAPLTPDWTCGAQAPRPYPFIGLQTGSCKQRTKLSKSTNTTNAINNCLSRWDAFQQLP